MEIIGQVILIESSDKEYLKKLSKSFKQSKDVKLSNFFA